MFLECWSWGNVWGLWMGDFMRVSEGVWMCLFVFTVDVSQGKIDVFGVVVYFMSDQKVTEKGQTMSILGSDSIYNQDFLFVIILSLKMIIGNGIKGANQVKLTNLLKGYHVIDMGTDYPFGQLRQIPSQPRLVLVRKKLHYLSKNEEATLLKTASILEKIRHKNLINLHHFQKESNTIYFCYQYAHLTIQRWILNLGDQMLEILKNQMLNLSIFLNQNRIAFDFCEKGVGLSSQVHVQYFLHEFSVLDQKQEDVRLRNQLLNRQKINRYFQRFKQEEEEANLLSMYSSVVVKRESGYESSMFCSITTRESWEVISPDKSKIREGSRSKKLSEKVEKSKAKTSEILYKLKNIKNLQF